jgi:hypothetical protein
MAMSLGRIAITRKVACKSAGLVLKLPERTPPALPLTVSPDTELPQSSVLLFPPPPLHKACPEGCSLKKCGSIFNSPP